jgi:heptose I phosphotransferase
LPVPRVLAAGEILAPWGRLQSFLAVEELAGMIGLHEAVPLAFARLDPTAFETWKRGLIHEVARLSRELHRRRAFHKDLYFCHFYIPEADCSQIPQQWQGRVVMIDFHRMAVHRLGWQWFLVKDLGQLLYSSDVPGVTARDRVRFWKHYLAGDWNPVRRPGAWLRNWIRRKGALYERHNAKRHSAAQSKDAEPARTA